MKLKEIHRTATFAWSASSSLPLLVTGTVAGALDESFSNESVLEVWKPDWLDRSEYELGVGGQEGGKGPIGAAKDSSRFNRLAWGATDVIAAGMENGELALWDAAKLCSAQDDALILRNNQHTGPVRGLAFNPIQTNLLSSGAVGGDVCIWDLKDPSKPYTPTPGSRSTKLDEITSIAWNNQVPYVLGGSSTTGYTVVWDLRGKREVVALAYGGGQGMVSGARRGMSDLAWCPDNATRLVTASEDDSSPVIMVWDLRNARAPEKILTGHEKGVLSLSWCKHDPDLLLSCGKDNRTLCWNPVEGTVIAELPPSNNWSFQTSWNPRNPSIFATAFFDGTIGIHSIQSTADEPSSLPLPSSSISASASTSVSTSVSSSSVGGEEDLFASIATSAHSQPVGMSSSLSVDSYTPEWYKVPVSVGWGFGGQIVSVSNIGMAKGKGGGGVVSLRKGVVTEGGVVERARKLFSLDGGDGEEIKKFAESGGDAEWKELLRLFEFSGEGSENRNREDMIRLLGYGKEEGIKKVREMVEKVKRGGGVPVVVPAPDVDPSRKTDNDDDEEETPHESLVSFTSKETADEEDVTPPSTAKTTSTRGDEEDEESNTTGASLFGGLPHDENDAIGGGADFFSTIGNTNTTSGGGMQIPHRNYPMDSSVAATAGGESPRLPVFSSSLLSTGAVTSYKSEEMGGGNHFRIMGGTGTATGGGDEEEVEKVLTRALILGDFEGAVDVCLGVGRWADGMLLASGRGDTDTTLIRKVQKAYFEHMMSQGGGGGYLRVWQSVVWMDDLEDVVQNAELSGGSGEEGDEEEEEGWKQIFTLLCIYSRSDSEFRDLVEQLGRRLEWEGSDARCDEIIAGGGGGMSLEGVGERKRKMRKDALVCYLASGRLERVVGVWVEDMFAPSSSTSEEEEGEHGDYGKRVEALQKFMEKVFVFRAATRYVDSALAGDTSTSGECKLGMLYERYLEYGEILAGQGLVDEAEKVGMLVPVAFGGEGRRRLVRNSSSSMAEKMGASGSVAATGATATGTTKGAAGYRAPAAKAGGAYGAPAIATATGGYGAYGAPQVQPAQSGPYGGYGGYGAAQQQQQPQQQPQQHAPPPPSQVGASPYAAAPAPAYGGSGISSYAPHHPSFGTPPPPPPHQAVARPPPPPGKRPQENGGWNDAPPIAIRPGSAKQPAGVHSSPFPNQQQPISPGVGMGGMGMASPGGGMGPPPPRPGSRGLVAPIPPPPKAGTVYHPQGGQQQQRPPSVGPGRMVSPANAGVGRAPTPSQYAPPPPSGRAPTPSQYAPPPRGPTQHGPPPSLPQQQQQQHGYAKPPTGYAPPPVGAQQHQQHQPPPPSGPYGQPPGQQQQQHAPPPPGPYGPPPGQQQQHQHGPPPPSGPYGPPPGQQQHQQQQHGGPPPPLLATSGPGQVNAPPPPPPAKKVVAPSGPKYPVGDRSHISDEAKPVYEVLSGILATQKGGTAPSQKRFYDDLERRINPLFDSLNCGTLSAGVVESLIELVKAMQARDQGAALGIHVDLITRGTQGDAIGMPMSGIKQLIMRL